MNLWEWVTNSTEVMKTVPKEERASGNSIKELELKWNFQKDILHICNSIRQPNQKLKLQILKATAEVLDSLGPFTTATLRELWEEKKEWDGAVKETQLLQWKQILNDFDTLHTIKLQRFVGNDECKLLCFSDVSGNSYVATVYLLTETNGKPNIELMFSKPRIKNSKKELDKHTPTGMTWCSHRSH